MQARHRTMRGFTIVELLVVISIIVLLIAILLPAVGKARETARVSVSRSNIKQISLALNAYAADWQDRQYTAARDTLSAYGSSVGDYNAEAYGNLEVHPGIPWGWGSDGHLYGYWMDDPHYWWAVEPINFDGPSKYFGWFRFPQTKAIHNYLGGRAFDKVFYAPKDRLSMAAVEPCQDDPGEVSTFGDCETPVWTTYCLSPAALYSPEVWRLEGPYSVQGFRDPWSLPGGFRAPTMSQVKYTDLKTHLLEHPWLQNVEVGCNPGFNAPGLLECEPYYFNHALQSEPVTAFYDGHVELVGVWEAIRDDKRMQFQTGGAPGAPGLCATAQGQGLWHRGTPFGPDGYLQNFGYDFAETSFHILTVDGAMGRDILGEQ